MTKAEAEEIIGFPIKTATAVHGQQFCAGQQPQPADHDQISQQIPLSIIFKDVAADMVELCPPHACAVGR
ncbi:MAG: hypothetical protein M0C28_33520 [Candidatus Moduliflexus flocculans]|nr:hypothetical protein [Candidatus Moduliflexus flocculans]